MVYFTADIHLGHKNILKHQPNRCFASLDEMDAALIDAINATVKRNDELWVLGDFAWKAGMYGQYRQRINARQIHVVTGNHDAPSLAQYVSSMNPMVYQKFNGQKFHLSHYPHVSWRGRTHGSIHLYGHTHGSLEDRLNVLWPDRKAMDVGVDHAKRILDEFRPFSLEEVLALTKTT